MRARPKRASATAGVEVNPGCLPDPANPHSWLVLTGDDANRDATRVMYGCLRPNFRGHSNSAAAFAAAKLTVGAPLGTPPWTLTAARAEVLLPPGADDRLSDPRTLMETVDAELPVKAKALLAYLTFTFPTGRLHEQYELVRDFTPVENALPDFALGLWRSGRITWHWLLTLWVDVDAGLWLVPTPDKRDTTATSGFRLTTRHLRIQEAPWRTVRERGDGLVRAIRILIHDEGSLASAPTGVDDRS